MSRQTGECAKSSFECSFFSYSWVKKIVRRFCCGTFLQSRQFTPDSSHPSTINIRNWEASYRPEWKDMNVLEWAESHNADINTMLKRLAGKGHDATEEDLLRATNTIRRHFVVGLVTEMEESFRRFNAVIGESDRE